MAIKKKKRKRTEYDAKFVARGCQHFAAISFKGRRACITFTRIALGCEANCVLNKQNAIVNCCESWPAVYRRLEIESKYRYSARCAEKMKSSTKGEIERFRWWFDETRVKPIFWNNNSAGWNANDSRSGSASWNTYETLRFTLAKSAVSFHSWASWRRCNDESDKQAVLPTDPFSLYEW